MQVGNDFALGEVEAILRGDTKAAEAITDKIAPGGRGGDDLADCVTAHDQPLPGPPKVIYRLVHGGTIPPPAARGQWNWGRNWGRPEAGGPAADNAH